MGRARMEEIEGKIGATFTLDNVSCTPPPSTTVVETSAEPTISGLPGELRILELERRFEEVVMENSENIVLLHALKKEIRKEVGQHVHHLEEEVKRHLTGAEDFHMDVKWRPSEAPQSKQHWQCRNLWNTPNFPRILCH